jgi:hypothetical protein
MRRLLAVAVLAGAFAAPAAAAAAGPPAPTASVGTK